MLSDVNELYIIGVAIVVIGILFFAIRARIAREPDPLRKAFRLYELHLAAIAVFLTVVWFTIPITSILRTSDYPNSVENIQSAGEVREVLQSYNRALVRTTAALHWFVLVFVAWFLLNTYRFCKVVVNVLSEKGNERK